MRSLRLIAAVFLTAIIAAISWDFLQIGRHVPEPASLRADRIVIEKTGRRLEVRRGDEVLKSYAVSLGAHPVGHKQQEGDGRTPEGRYAIDFKNPRSRFHLSLRVSYPNATDRTNASDRGVSPGGDIMIHGLPNGLGWLAGLHRFVDWTDGCIAVTNAEIEEIWSMTDRGTAVEINP